MRNRLKKEPTLLIVVSSRGDIEKNNIELPERNEKVIRERIKPLSYKYGKISARVNDRVRIANELQKKNRDLETLVRKNTIRALDNFETCLKLASYDRRRTNY